jgi:hypothetical protein
MSGTSENDLGHHLAEIDAQLREIDRSADGATRARCRAIVQTVLELHGAALERILRIVRERIGGDALVQELAGNDLVGSLLLLHGLHPLDFETRVRAALEKLRPAQQAAGAEAVLLGIEEGRVRILLERSGAGSAAARAELENALCAAAPDAVAVDIQEIVSAPVAWRRPPSPAGGPS